MTPINARRVAPRPPLTPEQQAVVERALPAARYVAAKYVRAYGPGLDWFGEISLRLCEHAGDYEPGRSNPNTWGTLHAHYACRELIRRSIPTKGRGKLRHRIGIAVHSLDAAATADGKTFAAMLPDRRQQAADVLGIEAGRDLLKGLTRIERAVAWSVLVEGRTQEEVAESLGVAATRVHQVKVAAIGRLREAHGLPAAAEGGVR